MDPDVTYRTASPRASSGVGIVILLYEQLVQDLRRAMTAIDRADVEARTSELRHALEVVGQLQARLDMQAGGEVAQNLDQFYAVLQAGILDAQFKVSKPLLGQLIQSVLSIREAWVNVEQSTTSEQASAENSATAEAKTQDSSGQAASRNWRI
jgi:flagellar secretion chaperone FliS